MDDGDGPQHKRKHGINAFVSSVPGPASAWSGEQTNDLFPLCPVRRVPGPASKLMIVSSVPGPANKLMI